MEIEIIGMKGVLGVCSGFLSVPLAATGPRCARRPGLAAVPERQLRRGGDWSCQEREHSHPAALEIDRPRLREMTRWR